MIPSWNITILELCTSHIALEMQKTIESSTFGSESLALHIATELIRGSNYRLRMMGIPLTGTVNILVDNDTVAKNSTIPSLTLQQSIMQCVIILRKKLWLVKYVKLYTFLLGKICRYVYDKIRSNETS
jgi:hypothetical protein